MPSSAIPSRGRNQHRAKARAEGFVSCVRLGNIPTRATYDTGQRGKINMNPRPILKLPQLPPWETDTCLLWPEWIANG